MANPFKILLVSLHKIGDNLQAAAALPVLASNYKNVHITVLSEAPFDFPFRKNLFVNELVLFDRQQFHEKGLKLLDNLKSRKFNLIINRQSSREGAAIAGHIGADEIRGYFLKSDGSGWVLDPWSRLLFAACRNRGVNPFNFVDYSINIAGKWSSNRALSLNVEKGAADDVLRSIGGNSSRVVAVQVASNAERRQWGTEKFGLAVNKVLSANRELIFAFIGTDSESKHIQNAISIVESQYKNRVHDLSGKVSMEELPDFLQRCILLVTNDTGPMHIAAAVNCPVIAIYAGESFINETGPYSPDNWIIHAEIDCLPCLTNNPCTRNFKCKDMVTPESVADYVGAKVSGIEVPMTHDGVVLYHSGSRFLREEIRYRPLLKRQFVQNDFYRYLFYVTFREFINNEVTDIELIVNEISSSWNGIDRVIKGINGFPTDIIEQFSLVSGEKEQIISLASKNGSELMKLLS